MGKVTMKVPSLLRGAVPLAACLHALVGLLIRARTAN